MEPIHIVCNKDKIASRVLFPGDPLRAKYIAKKYLENAELVNDVRNMLGYTGTYKGKKITVIGSGMGIPSAGLYAYELFKFYNVKKLIRIGSAGALKPTVYIRDIILATNAYSHSSFRYCLTKNKSKKIASSNKLNQIILSQSEKLNIKVNKGIVYTTDVFDGYENIDHVLTDVPKNVNLLAAEMEAFGIFTVADLFKRDATCLVSISDSKFDPERNLTAEERQNTLDKMIYLALESIVK